MWNIEMNNNRSELINKINNEGEIKAKTEVISNSVKKYRNKALGIKENDDKISKTVTLKSSKKGETKNSGCCEF